MNVKHARQDTLELLEPLLQKLRKYQALVERTPGAFYLKSKAYLHFHQDPSGIYADVKLNFAEFTRIRATTPNEQARLLSLIDKSLKH